ncbi:heme exporter protein CcmD [Glaciecola sp. 1036]|uniref:heme exporter protein CcmD n=1 Tax=Alteromonadaceae TaxID=72275 RepID=UPI003CFBE37E
MNDSQHQLHRLPNKGLLGILSAIFVIWAGYMMVNQGFQFSSISSFWDMAGRGYFVWLSFALSFLCMMLLLSHTLFMNKMVKIQVKQQQARAERILAARAKRNQKNSEVISNESKA